MRKRWIATALAGALAVGAATAYLAADADMRALIRAHPTNANVLFWSEAQRDAGFRTLDRVPVLAKSRTIAAGGAARPLPAGAPLTLPNLDAYLARQRVAGLVVLVDGRVRLERYGLAFTPEGRWTSFSVAKSLTSTLAGAALRDGAIRSLDDPVTAYLPALRGSAYDDVTVRQLLTMTSGVKWNEDYEDPDSDVARFNNHRPEPGIDATVSYMRTLPREAPAGTKWVYKTGETNLIGVLVSAAVKKPLAQYLSEKIWRPYGMEADATWLLSPSGAEISGCCVQARTRDFARFGQFILEGGHGVVPPAYLAAATTKQAAIGEPDRGYGFQWWTNDDGTFAAQGIFGQGIFIDPRRRLVIATNANWPRATDRETLGPDRQRFYAQVQAALDAGD